MTEKSGKRICECELKAPNIDGTRCFKCGGKIDEMPTEKLFLVAGSDTIQIEALIDEGFEIKLKPIDTAFEDNLRVKVVNVKNPVITATEHEIERAMLEEGKRKEEIAGIITGFKIEIFNETFKAIREGLK